MLDKKRNIIQIGISSVVAVVILVVCIIGYNGFLYRKLTETSRVALEEIIIQQSLHITTKFENDTSTLQLIAKEMVSKDFFKNTSQDLLLQIGQNTSFDAVAAIDLQGNVLSSRGERLNISNREYFQKSLKGEVVISDPLSSEENGTRIIISVPVVLQGKIAGMLAGEYDVADLDKLLVPSFDGMGYTYVLTKSGEVIAESINEYALRSEKNVFKSLESATFYGGESYATMRKNINEGISGQCRYTLKDEKRIMQYASLNINDWSIVSVIPEEVITDNLREISIGTIVVSLVIISIFFAMLVASYHQLQFNLKTIEEIAFVDDLTKAPTLAKFQLEAQRFIDAYPNKKLLMVMFDVDRFNLINQILGEKVGDRVLKSLAQGLRENTAGPYQRFARIHDDEFMVLHEYETPEQLLVIRDEYQRRFYELMESDFQYSIKLISGHYYMQFENCKNAAEAIEKAQIAHRKAKQTHQEICVYDENFVREALRKKEIEDKMRLALDRGEFKVYLQPQYYLQGETVSGGEALVRWIPQDGAMIYPNDFIPIFEENGFIASLDMYMFEQVCKIIQGWMADGLDPVVLSVNFSRKHIPNTNFVNTLCHIADRYGVPHKYLGVEITEGIFFDNENAILEVLRQLHENDFTLLMDDFGTGYSSLGMLKNIPVDVIKIDKSFFDRVDDEARAKAVLMNVLKMAKDLQIQTVAEGVETAEIATLLRGYDCDIAQGYYYARPMPAENFHEKLEKRTEEIIL